MRFLKDLPRHGWKAFVAAGVWLAVVAPASAAADTLDQSQPTGVPNSFSMRSPMAQTFTAGMDGQLDKVSLRMSNPFGGVSVRIYDASGNQPTVSGLGQPTSAGTLPCCLLWYDFILNPAVPITKDTQYAIVLTNGPAPVTWYSSGAVDAYARGQMLFKSGSTWMTLANAKDAAFKTFVAATATPTNQAPTISTSGDPVIVNEGTAATKTGTYYDPDGDTVSFTASAGSVTKTGTSSGTWSWTQPAADEGPTTFVTVTADDSHGHAVPATFSVTVHGVAPTALIHGAPASAVEGTPVSLTASAWSPSAEDNAGPWSYAWTLTKNGSSFGPGTGTGAAFSFTPDDEGTFVVTLEATDDGGLRGTTSATITGANALPVVTITNVTAAAPLVVTTQETLTFTGHFSDAGALDTHSAVWTFGEGPAVSMDLGAGGSGTFTATHAFSTAGPFTVTLTVTDDDGGSGHATRSVLIQSPVQAIGAISTYLQNTYLQSTTNKLSKGELDSLTAKLRAATASAQRGDTNASCNQLNAFLNEVDAASKTGRLSSGTAATLTSATRATQRSLGCFRSLVEFLGAL